VYFSIFVTKIYSGITPENFILDNGSNQLQIMKVINKEMGYNFHQKVLILKI
jgi:hypothetical protein